MIAAPTDRSIDVYPRPALFPPPLAARRRAVVPAVGAVLALAVLAGCGSDDSDGDDLGAPGTTESIIDDPTPAEVSTSDDGTDGGDPPPPPAERSGTITLAGTPTEIGDGDFDICETVNPAFAGDFNIVTRLDDGTKIRLSGNVDGDFDEHEGLFLGQIPDEERADGLEVSLDGRALSGTASTSAGTIEFTFTC